MVKVKNILPLSALLISMVSVLSLLCYEYLAVSLIHNHDPEKRTVPESTTTGRATATQAKIKHTEAIRQGAHDLAVMNKRKEEWLRYFRLSANKPKAKRLPDVVGIGVKKCGTDAVISFLKQHPLVKVPRDVEAMFFHHGNYVKGLEFYKNKMPVVADHELVMEKSPPYFNAPPMDLPNRIKKDLPNAKLILILCEPVKRAFSDYTHERYKFEKLGYKMMKDYATFDSYLDVYLDSVNRTLVGSNEDILNRHMERYHKDGGISTLLENGMYSLHLPRWTNLFDSTKLLILNGEDMMHDPGSQMGKMQEFLRIPKLINGNDFIRHPETGLFCIRPYWKEYDFEAERKQTPGWEKQLFCLSFNKERTRKPKDRFLATEEHVISLTRLYRRFNEELFEMTGIKYF